MSSLKSRILVSFTASLLIFLIIFAVTVFFGFNLSLKDWNRANEEKVITEITEILEDLYRNGKGELESVKKALSPHLKENMEITLFSPSGEIIFTHNSSKDRDQQYFNEFIIKRLKDSVFPDISRMTHERGMLQPGGKPFPPPPPEPPEPPGIRGNSQGMRQYMRTRIMEALPGQVLVRPVIADRELKAFVKVKSLRLRFYSRANRKFINSIIITLITGTIAALAIALSSSWVISKKLTRDAAALSEGLNSLAGGSRDVVFPVKGSSEILSISESASILQKELIHDEERKKQWTQDIAHDLRTPITAVRAQIEAVRDGVFRADSSRLEKLLKELARLENLVEDMNSLSRIESSSSIPDIEEVSTEDLGAALKERFEFLAGEKGIDLDISSENFTLRCDMNLMIRALSNLVQNSIKYSGRGSSVRVEIRKEGNIALFSVKNPGFIEETEIKKIFNRLYRGETGRTSEGSGLGLTIAAAIARQHKGEIKAENIEGSIVFRLTVPC